MTSISTSRKFPLPRGWRPHHTWHHIRKSAYVYAWVLCTSTVTVDRAPTFVQEVRLMHPPVSQEVRQRRRSLATPNFINLETLLFRKTKRPIRRDEDNKKGSGIKSFPIFPNVFGREVKPNHFQSLRRRALPCICIFYTRALSGSVLIKAFVKAGLSLLDSGVRTIHPRTSSPPPLLLHLIIRLWFRVESFIAHAYV